MCAYMFMHQGKFTFDLLRMVSEKLNSWLSAVAVHHVQTMVRPARDVCASCALF